MKRAQGRPFDEAIGALLLVAVPLALWSIVGLPTIPTALTQGGLIAAAASLAWLAWGWAVCGLVVAVTVRIIHRDVTVDPSGRHMERLAARIAGIALALGSILGGIGSSASAAAPAAAPSSTLASTVEMVPTRSPQTHLISASTSQATSSTPASTATYVVQSGDCLWSIALQLWGDGDQWRLLSAANLGHVMEDGRLFVDPSVIMPGWRLAVPQLTPSGVQSSEPGHLSAVLPITPAAPSLNSRPPRAETLIPPHLLPPAARPQRRSAVSPSAADSAVVISLGIGSCALLLGLLRRRRRRVGPLPASSSPLLVDADIDLARLEPLVVLGAVERAALLAAADGALVDVGLLCVGDEGATLFIEGRSRWRAAASDIDRGSGNDAKVPGLLISLGDDEGGTWSLIIPPGCSTSIGGSGARSLIDASLALQSELAWGHLIHVIDDPEELHKRLALCDDDELFVDAGEIGPGTHPRRCQIRPTLVADVCVDEDVVTLSSLDRRLKGAHLSKAALALLETRTLSDPMGDEAPCADDDGEVGTTPLPEALNRTAITPRSVVRLLTAVPRIDGLEEELEARRSRRATELVAYLALHHPTPVTGDRLRSRVLGSSTSDAAAKTLFNVASAARRALGLDSSGLPLLPSASRSGLYRCGEEVRVDVQIVEEQIALADGAPSKEREMAHLRAALELIESEPMSSVLAGYEWFVAEGHQGRLVATVERAATRLVALALGAALPALAELALARAQLVVPYSETLATAAMDVAAAKGDLDGLRRAFDDLSRLIDEIDPGASPDRAAELRYASLRSSIVDVSAQASLAAMEAAPRSTSPSAPAAL